MAFAKPEYSRGQVDAAGRALADAWGSPSEVDDEALRIISNWRAAHAFPLQVIKMMLKQRAQRTDPRALVSQRLKRLPSIRRKLERSQTETIRLSQVQDVGGCRAVLSNINAVDRLVKLFEQGVAKNPTGRHELVGAMRDYIGEPKLDGYRGIHYVFKYKSNSPARAVWNNLRIEVQLRSQLQHAWATAVETVDTLTGQSLKFALGSNIGDRRWRRFFALMGSAMALRERRSLVPGTPQNVALLIDELREVANELSAAQVLTRLGEMVRVLEVEQSRSRAAEYLLVLDASDKSIRVMSFAPSELSQVEEEYLKLEKEDNPDLQVVQVSVDDINGLRKAYPNYYLDTQAFVAALRAVIRQKGEQGRNRQTRLFT
jgi:DNA-binding transcriptional MerR regulator